METASGKFNIEQQYYEKSLESKIIELYTLKSLNLSL